MKKRFFNNKVSLVPCNQIIGPIHFGWSISPFGQCFILHQSNAIIGLSFKNDRPKNQIECDLSARWRKRNIIFKPVKANKIVEKIFNNVPINISFSGSQLQEKVWRALLTVPMGETKTYTDIANVTGNPNAIRAVATAIGQNPIAWLIPCHRIIKKSGELGGYRWGINLKKIMLSNETIV